MTFRGRMDDEHLFLSFLAGGICQEPYPGLRALEVILIFLVCWRPLWIALLPGSCPGWWPEPRPIWMTGFWPSFIAPYSPPWPSWAVDGPGILELSLVLRRRHLVRRQDAPHRDLDGVRPSVFQLFSGVLRIRPERFEFVQPTTDRFFETPSQWSWFLAAAYAILMAWDIQVHGAVGLGGNCRFGPQLRCPGHAGESLRRRGDPGRSAVPARGTTSFWTAVNGVR